MVPSAEMRRDRGGTCNPIALLVASSEPSSRRRFVALSTAQRQRPATHQD